MAAISRLTASDLANLATEAPDTPMHQAVLAVVEGKSLLDAGGRVRIGEIGAHFESRLARLPELRRRLRPTRFPFGPALWEDDPGFRIENHVHGETLAPPGGVAGAVAFAEAEMGRLMDRSRPLWDVWFLDGYRDRQLAVLIKLHHALADGPAMINMLAQLFDLEPVPFERPQTSWAPSAGPKRRRLFEDNVHRKVAGFVAAARAVRHPLARIRAAVSILAAFVEGGRESRGAPRTSLNRPIGRARRIGFVDIDLAAARSVAHAHGVKLNDVFMAIVAASCRGVLLARGEHVDGLELHASMAVSMRGAGDEATTGNNIGTEIVPLPLDVPDPVALLRRAGVATRKAKQAQKPVLSSRLMIVFAKTGLARLYIRRQHLTNVLTTNLPGPPVALYFAGGRIEQAIAMPPIAGNVTVSFAGLSYAGRFCMSAVADAASWPDLDLLLDRMQSAWAELEAATPVMLARSA